MFSRRKRLSRSLFPTVLTSGRRLSSPNFSIVFSGSAEGYAVIVPNKVARLSVTRHRIKRRVSAILRTLSLPKALIVFPRSSANSVSYEEMKTELANLIP